jgi:PAS domain S-box-containing protein
VFQVHEVEEDGRAPVVSGPEGPEERNGESVHGAEEVASSPCASCGESSREEDCTCPAAEDSVRRMLLPRNSRFLESADFLIHLLETAEMAESLGTLLDAATIYTILLDPEGRILFPNRLCCVRFGKSLEALLGTVVFDLFPPELAASRRARFEEAVASRSRVSFRDRAADGTFFDMTVVPIFRNERVFRVAVFANDVTDLVVTRHALEVSEERFRLVLEGSGEGYWDWDIPAGTVYHSPRCAELLGYDPSEIEAADLNSWRSYVHPDDIPMVESAIRANLEGTTAFFEVQVRVRAKNGAQKWVLSRAKVTARDEAGRPLRMSGVHVDITAVKQTEVELAKAGRLLTQLGEMNQALQANRLATMGTMVAGVTHEINNPVASIRMNAELLRENLTTPRRKNKAELLEERLDYVNAIVRLTERLERIVDGLKSFSRRREIRVEPVLLASCLAESWKLACSDRKRVANVEMDMQVETDIRVSADSQQLLQVFVNVLLNAVKAVNRMERPLGHLWVRGKKSGGEAVVTIEDDGCGIDPQDLPHIFDPFFSTDPASGMGLGLSVTHSILVAHGGSIAAASELGKGTTVTIRLPLIPSL